MIPIRENRLRVLERWSERAVGIPKSVKLTFDEEWSPYVQGEATLPNTILNAVVYPGVDSPFGIPQGDVMVLDLQTRYRGSFTLADLTADVGGTVAAATARWGGSTRAVTTEYSSIWNPGERIEPLARATEIWGGSTAAVTAEHGGNTASLTAALRVPGGTHLAPPTDRLRVKLRVRNRRDNGDGTTTFDLASEDVRLHDYRLAQNTPIETAHATIRDLVEWVLAKIHSTAPDMSEIVLAPGSDRGISAWQEWMPGQTAWEFLHPILEATGWSLTADEQGVYRLEPRTVTDATVTLDPALNLLSHEYHTDLDKEWYDGAIVEYTDADPEIPSQRFDVYAPAANRTIHETRPGIRTNTGAAQQLVLRSETRARTADAEALLLLPLRPRQRVATYMGEGIDGGVPYPIYRHGTIRSLTHDSASGTTTLKLRDTTS